MTPWVPDANADGGFRFIHHIVCKKCSYVIKEDGAIFEGGRYICPKCGYEGGDGRRTMSTSKTEKTCVLMPGKEKRVVCLEETKKTTVRKRKAL